MNSDHTYLAKLCTFIDCILEKISKHVHKYVRENLYMDVIMEDGNRLELGIDTIILMITAPLIIIGADLYPVAKQGTIFI